MTEPTTQALIELRGLAEAATPGRWHITKSGDSHWMREVRDINGQGVAFCGGEINQSHKDAAYIAAANPAKVIELLDALDAQAREIEQLARGWNACIAVLLKAQGERDTLKAELAAIRTQEPVVDVNAGLVELPEIPVYPMPTPFYPQAHVYSREQMQDYARQAIATARTQQAPKGVE